ncbi:hypothetical protein JCM19233_1873 [Vibrio astriarenae]|nr:hypothetical protein JCM19233_1873 [Vibrio sp. C7]
MKQISPVLESYVHHDATKNQIDLCSASATIQTLVMLTKPVFVI